MKGLTQLLLWVLTSILPSWLVMSSLPIWWEIPDGRRRQGAAKGDTGSDIFRINTQLSCSSSVVKVDLITFSVRTEKCIKELSTLWYNTISFPQMHINSYLVVIKMYIKWIYSRTYHGAPIHNIFIKIWRIKKPPPEAEQKKKSLMCQSDSERNCEGQELLLIIFFSL